MIQFNLLPDVKLEYIKARRAQRLVLLGSTIVTVVSVSIMVVLFFGTNVLQRRHISNLHHDIDADSKQLQKVPDLNKILTVQNQLNSLTELHDKKPVAARLGVYLGQLTPNDLSIESLEVNFTDNTISFEGSSNALSVVNKFIDTLKFTTFEADSKSNKAFSEVVLASFGRSDQEQGGGGTKPATYKVTLKFEPTIFDGAHETQLKVPNLTSSRSSTEKPNALFKQSDDAAGGQ